MSYTYLLFYLCKFLAPKITYAIYNKQLFVIITKFEQWGLYLFGAHYKMKVLLDHKSLVYFICTHI